METLVNANKIEEIRCRLGFAGSFTVDRTGRGGGLAVLWKSENLCIITGYSSHHIDMEVLDLQHSRWRLTGFYGHSERSRRTESWDLLRNLFVASTLAWCCLGDFNNLLSVEDKHGGVDYPQWLLTGFRNAVSDCSLFDMPLCGYPFTWERGRGTNNLVEERLDRALVTDSWLSLFPHAKLVNLLAPVSDHTPLLLETDLFIPTQYQRRFRFENIWLQEAELNEVVSSNWRSTVGSDLPDRFHACALALARWGKGLSNKFKDQIVACKNYLERLRNSSDPTLVAVLQEQKTQLGNLLMQEEKYWRQRAKMF
ncbi:hypothetical protein MRB53_002353 [Persea americana]|uniref:Uncharacterized protein n=1 Tax=Persea americana TaxID=3435 RepID=A0ACC2MUA4_PERAE|nr:hypothetical protein MRB53_002353 [Persea americana]